MKPRKMIERVTFAALFIVGDSKLPAIAGPVATEWEGGRAISLGGLSGFTSSEAKGINDLGQAVGWSAIGNVQFATEWNGGSIVNLGVGQASAINDVGQVVGTSGGVATEWTGGRARTLGMLPGYTGSIATGINNAGQVVGYSITGPLQNPTSQRATEWIGGSIIGLKGPGGAAETRAYSINGLGQVGGVGFSTGGLASATVWTGGNPSSLMEPPRASASGANALNSTGQAVGGIFIGGVDFATKWIGGTAYKLDSTNSVAFGVNQSGQTVGYTAVGQIESAMDPHAIEWSDGRSVELRALLGSPYGAAFGINDAGQVVGYSLVPESSLSTLSSAASALSGEAATGAATASIGLAGQFMSLMLDPLVYGSTPATSVSDLASDKRSTTSTVLLPRGWNVWASGFGGSTAANGDANVGSHNTLANGAGLAAGVDYSMAPGARLGFALAGLSLGWGVADGLGGGSGNAFQAGLYGSVRRGPIYVAASTAFAEEWLTTSRAGPFGGSLTATYAAQDFGGRLELGDTIGLNLLSDPISVSPYVALQAQTFRSPAYAESDLSFSGFGLSYSSSSQGYGSGEIGMRFEIPIQLLNSTAVDLRAQAAYAHNIQGGPIMNAAYEVLPSSAFIVRGAALPKNAALATAEADFRLGAKFSTLVKLDSALAPRANAVGGSVSVQYAF